MKAEAEHEVTADIALTKQSGAHRLILSALRMLERSEDRLAIHVVAASALNMLRELVNQRGPTYASRAFAEGLYQGALDKRDGAAFPFEAGEEIDRVVAR